jgi:monovalent cation:H+ antiporter, CPA1 family
VIGVVTTGLILGNFGSRIGMNPRTRAIVSEFWEFLSFFVNSIVFLLIGDLIHFAVLAENWVAIGVTIAAMLLSRAISIYGLGSLSNRLASAEISIPERTVLWWGGLRGAVSIALALSVPENIPGRDAIVATVFGTVLFTLLVPGLTIQPLLARLDLLGDQPMRQHYLEIVARQTALNRVLEHLGEIDRHPGVEPDFYQYQVLLVQGELTRLQTELDDLQNDYPDLQTIIAEQLRDELLAIEADTYAQLVQAGRLDRELSPLMEVEKTELTEI